MPVRLGYAFAARSEKVAVEVVGTHEFKEIAFEHGVVLLPKTWVNRRTFIEGGAPDIGMMERAMVMAIRQAQDPSIPPGKLRMGSSRN